MILTNSNEKRKSWLFGWFSHLTTTHHQRQPPFPPPRPQANRHNNNDWRTVDDDSTPMSRTASNSSTRTGGAEDFATYSPRQRLSFPPLTAPGTPERRNSQQTTTSSIMSDDQYSSSSCHRRNSNERSILSELWSKARRHHPHYPRFHWPPRRHHHHICHCQRHESSFFVDQQAHSVGGTPRRSHDDPVGYEDELIPPNQLQQKRHSITSLVSSGSRPTSLFGSQPESPAFHPTKEQQQEDEDAVVVAEPCRPRRPNEPFERWTVAPELVRLAFDDQLFCSPFDISPSAGAAEKHVLHVGCGDGSWATEVALQYPKWTVVGMDDREGRRISSPIRRMGPRNFKFIRCHDSSLLEGLKRISDETYDLVHCRFLTLSYTAEQYQELVNECWRICKPGGYVELLEMDMRIYHYRRSISGHITQKFNSEVIHVMESKSLDPRLARRLKDLFGDGHDRHVMYHGSYSSLPLGVWGGRLGVMFREDIHRLFELFEPAVAEFNGTPVRTDKELESAFESMDAEMESQWAFMNMHHAYAQKILRP